MEIPAKPTPPKMQTWTEGERKTIFKKVEPLSMRLLVVVAILALLVQTATMLFVTLREQKNVTVTIINVEKP